MYVVGLIYNVHFKKNHFAIYNLPVVPLIKGRRFINRRRIYTTLFLVNFLYQKLAENLRGFIAWFVMNHSGS